MTGAAVTGAAVTGAAVAGAAVAGAAVAGAAVTGAAVTGAAVTGAARRSAAWRCACRLGVWLAGVAACAALAGCWQTPPRGWYDGGPVASGACDGGLCCADGGCCVDGGCDEPDGGVVPPRPRERVCDDGLDNNGNGLSDCDDFDCADHASCCADGVLLFQEYWSAPDLSFQWDHLPRAAPTSSPVRVAEGATTMLRGWPDREPHALVWNSCVPLALGAELRFEAIATARGSVCRDWYEPCDRYAAVVLSPVADTLPGQPLLDDLAVRVHGDARVTINGTETVINQAMVRVTQGERELTRVLIEPEVRYDIALRVTPSTHEGVASLRADLEVRRAGAPPEDAGQTEGGFFVRAQATLERDVSGCLDVGGLYAGVQLLGDGARLGPIRAETLACANPSQFHDSPNGTATLTSGSLGVPASYGGAYIGAPSLGSSFNSASDAAPRWDLFFEASNEAPELALVAPVGFAISHARSATFGALSTDWSTSSTPRLGEDPPSCLASGGGCADESVRDPFLLVRRDAGDVLQDFTLAFAARLPTGAHTLRIEEDVSFSPSVPLGGNGVPVITPDGACRDLRDPALLAVGGGTGGYWLFFTCIPDAGPSYLRAARLENDFSLRAGTVQPVLTPSAVGSLASGGLFGPEPILRRTAAGSTLQLWFVARDGAGNTTLGLATGQLPTTEAPDGGVALGPPLEVLPPLAAYVANPVLRGNEPVLGVCPGLCRITGAAVSDTAGVTDQLRFLIARRMVHPGGAVTSDLVPLTQMWRGP